VSSAWITYRSGVEVEQPQEQQMINQIVSSMRRANEHVFDKRRHAVRDAHAKSHGILKGMLSVYPFLSKELAQGIFQPGRQYPLVARLSSSHGEIHSDEVRALKGLAVKVIGVEGRKLLAGQEHEVTQDFLLANLPVLPFGDVRTYLEMQRKEEERMLKNEPPPGLLAEIASTASSALKSVGLTGGSLDVVGPPAHHILGETFHSMAAIRFGRYVAKLSVAPLSPPVTGLTGQAVEIGGNSSRYRDLVAEFFRSQRAEYEIRAQLCTDLERMPVEDASVVWDPELSPHLPLARLIFEPQDTYSPARRVYGDEVLSFNPWHCIEDHRPLGSVMRARIAAYEASTQFRHTMNGQPRIEPRDIAEIPD
jgi:Catalase